MTAQRVGVVGYGYWGSKHVRVLNGLPDVEVIVIDADPTRLVEAQRVHGPVRVATSLDDCLDDLDAVVVAAPPGAHAALATTALDAGKGVLVEKPLATSVADAEAMVELARTRGACLMVGHTFEYNPAVWKLKEIVDSGELGRILYIDTARLDLGRYQNDCNVIWDLAPHDISIVSYLLDEMPDETAVWARRHVGREHADVAYLRMNFPRRGVSAYVHVSWLDPCKVRRVTVVGERKMAVYNDLSDNERVRIYDIGVDALEPDDVHARPVSYRNGDIVSPYIQFAEPLLVQDTHFVESLRTGRRPATPGERGLDVVRVLASTDDALLPGSGRIETMGTAS
ncbi:Gfo/Idh/MocA family oxidoreductase [Actinomycetospora endophytica]|uniref:Gfo/Idh/MocA family oxidoreductase n=1 Tax=Actinomycetospora endophytica TaxID=2291215 RepID=A0ABS8PCV2_9PSEU|nr:Gfo/Idh/MocA family oxidoreductase [Actinomycetospora endophytica]MCD2195823.1 Gfo/Idh/MocA family oxidoreductase [Actinomycetospora endophytica]